MRFVSASILFMLAAAPGAEAQEARLRAARDACWQEQGYAGAPGGNIRIPPSVGDAVSACVRRRMGAPAGGQPRR